MYVPQRRMILVVSSASDVPPIGRLAECRVLPKVQGNMTNTEIYMCIFDEFFTIDRELCFVVLNRMKPCV